MKVYIGWDQRDIAADRVCKSTLLKHASIPVEIINLKEFEMRARGLYWRPFHVCSGRNPADPEAYPNGQMVDDVDGKPFSTGFSFTRFLIPELEEFKDEWVLFMDADMMWRADIAELQAYTEEQKAIICVKHSYAPPDTHKMDGVVQEVYNRKNWSSVMLMNPSRCRALDRDTVNTSKGSYLHGMFWLEDDQIGELPVEWNFLCGHNDPNVIDPKIVHFTRGTADMGWVDEPFADDWIQALAEADPTL